MVGKTIAHHKIIYTSQAMVPPLGRERPSLRYSCGNGLGPSFEVIVSVLLAIGALSPK